MDTSTATHLTDGGLNDKPISLAIVGGGISGLCLALGVLNKASHIKFHVYEAAAQFSEVGLGIAVGINAQRALKLLDPRLGEAYGKLRTSNVDFKFNSSAEDEHDREKETYIRVVMGMDHATNPAFKAGEEVCEVFCDDGFSSVHRARFLDQLVALVPENVRETCVTFGAKLVGIEDTKSDDGRTGVRLNFANGSTAVADAVIGSDGIKSQVRREVLGDDAPESHPVFTGKYAYRGLLPMEEAVAALGDESARNAHHRIGYGGHVLTFPIYKGETMNVVAFRTLDTGHWDADSEWVLPATRSKMLDDFKGWGDEVHTILNMMQRCDMWALFDHLPAKTYRKQGRICLIGDAAHASTPHHGAGSGMAMEDSLLLSNLLADVHERKELESAFVAFEQSRKERTQRLPRSSREQAELYDFEAANIKDDVGKIAQVLPDKWNWIWGHNATIELEYAKLVMMMHSNRDKIQERGQSQ